MPETRVVTKDPSYRIRAGRVIRWRICKTCTHRATVTLLGGKTPSEEQVLRFCSRAHRLTPRDFSCTLHNWRASATMLSWKFERCSKSGWQGCPFGIGASWWHFKAKGKQKSETTQGINQKTKHHLFQLVGISKGQRNIWLDSGN